MGVFRVLVFSAATFSLISCVNISQSESDDFKLGTQRNLDKMKLAKQLSTLNELKTTNAIKKHDFGFGNIRKDDFLVGIERETFIYLSKEDHCYVLEYPLHGRAAISYIHLIVRTIGEDCKANITDGGIGKDNVAITFHVTSTILVHYTTFIYGYGLKFRSNLLTCKNPKYAA